MFISYIVSFITIVIVVVNVIIIKYIIYEYIYSHSYVLQAAYPPNHYIRTVPQRKVHLFTAVQLVQLFILCSFGFAPLPYLKVVFPILLLLLLPARFELIINSLQILRIHLKYLSMMLRTDWQNWHFVSHFKFTVALKDLLSSSAARKNLVWSKLNFLTWLTILLVLGMTLNCIRQSYICCHYSVGLGH